jgi:polysaccharide export outer membrane protein
MEANFMRRYSSAMIRVRRFIAAFLAALVFLSQGAVALEAPATAAVSPPSQMVQIGVGDQVRVDVFGLPELTTTTAVAADGTIRLPLTGAVQVLGQSPTEAAKAIETALVKGEFVLDPRATVTMVQSSSQRVSVLGEVRAQGRYPIESNTTVLDVIALAGGITEMGSDVVEILRNDSTTGVQQKLTVNLREAASHGASAGPALTLHGGDTISVKKRTFIITGEVKNPGEYRIEGDMVLLEALARAGDVTQMGSTRRVEIRRRGADGKYVVIKGKKNTRIEPGDLIKVNERVF